MEFYLHQERARKKTARLVVLFSLGVLGLMLVTYFLLALINAIAIYGERFDTSDLWNPSLFAFSIFFVGAIVGVSSLYKMAQLKKGGGASVAEGMGGRLLHPNSANFNEKKILNVVEEIAVATGIAPPRVYLLDAERGINAFAAGFTPDEAVIGITRGAIETLTREELQGVIAHEFSHILNGDMRMNIRLMGILFGILALGITGYYILRSSFYFRGAQNSQSKGPGAMVVVLLGLGLMAIGFVGSFFGQLIKASINREREFLADASAVEYTRDPDTIGKALIKIRDFSYGSMVLSPAVSEVSHMFFAEGVLSGFASLFATHPPIEERIQRIYAESYKRQQQKQVATAAKKQSSLMNLVDAAGAPNSSQISLARELINSLDPILRRAAVDNYGSEAIIYALLLSKDPEIKRYQLKKLSENANYSVLVELKALLPAVNTMDVRARLPLIDMSLAALRVMSKERLQPFIDNVHAVILADRQKDLFEWVVEKIILRAVTPHLDIDRCPVCNKNLSELMWYARELMQVLARVGHKDMKAEELAYIHGLKALGVSPGKYQHEEIDFKKLDDILNVLLHLKQQDKRKLLHALSICLQHDHEITTAEAEFFRAIADSIDYALPLVVATAV